jgi:hypothetical protein
MSLFNAAFGLAVFMAIFESAAAPQEPTFNAQSTVVLVPTLVALLVCLIPTTIGGLLSAIGIAGMDRMIQKNVIAMSGRAVEAAGDVDVLLLDKTGTITLGNRQATAFLPAPGVSEATLADAAQLASLADETPEGRSIVVLAKEKYQIREREIEKLGATFVPFTAQTRMSGVNLNGRQVRKGAADAIEAHVKKLGGSFPPEVRLGVDTIAKSGATPLVVCDAAKVVGVIQLKDIVKGGMKQRFLQLREMGIKTVMVTGDNPRFIRNWFEISFGGMMIGVSSRKEAKESRRKWFPYQKGGEFRKWYGNLSSVVDWEHDGKRLLGMKSEGYKVGSTNHNLDYIFCPAVVWTKVTIAEPTFRISPAGFLFDDASGLCVSRGELKNEYILAFLCSRPGVEFLKTINPTVNTGPGNLAVLPITEKASKAAVIGISGECISLSRADWDNLETSWDFRDQPLLRPGMTGTTLAASWQNWEFHCQAAIRRIRELETENNRLFIAAYGLQDEFIPEVPEEQITLARPDVRKDMAGFLSYAVGCMMGRYSLDHPGGLSGAHIAPARASCRNRQPRR